MIYGSVCSGIEAATAAWHSLGWEPAFFSEIEKFPRAVLEYRLNAKDARLAGVENGVPLWGDFTTLRPKHLKIIGAKHHAIDLLVGGTPCQSFSIAGLRGGMDDDRGNLALEYIKLAKRFRAQWVAWENVPGVFSSNAGEDFRCFLSGLAGWDIPLPKDGWKNSGIINAAPRQGNYGLAWRVLDAQYFGVPQRRRRVFVVGYSGDWRPAAAVLFERESLLRNPPPSREQKQDVAGTITSGADRRRGAGQDPGSLVPDTAKSLRGNSGGVDREDMHTMIPAVAGTILNNGKAAGSATQQCAENGLLIPTAYGGNNTAGSIDVATAVKGNNSNYDFESETFLAIHGTQDPDTLTNLAHTLGRNNGQENAVLFDTTQITNPENRSQPSAGKPCHTLSSQSHPPALAISGRVRGDDGRGYDRPEHLSEEVAGTVDATKPERVWALNYLVRRLTPVECGRLQGFKDNWTQIPWKNKPAEDCPDGPQYKAYGNSMAVPVMRWLGLRIEKVREILNEGGV